MSFLKEYWPWIVVPMALVFCALGILLFLSGGEDSSSPFIYNVF